MTDAYEFRESIPCCDTCETAVTPVAHAFWPVGEARVFVRVKVRNGAGVHVADGYVLRGDDDE